MQDQAAELLSDYLRQGFGECGKYELFTNTYKMEFKKAWKHEV